MKLLRLSAFCLLPVLVITIWACTNKSSELTEEIITNETKTVITSIQGRVLNEQLQPLQGAAVASGGKTTTTDVNGQFMLESISVNQDAAVVTVTRTDYFDGIRTLVVNENSLHYVQITLQPHAATATVNGATGGTVIVPGGSITLPASALLLSNNNLYSGIADVNFKYISPERDNFSDVMPGDLRGVTKAKIQQGLQSFGMLGLEFTGQNGEKLHLDNTKALTLLINIPGSLVSSAPAQIQLWFFDVTSGLWQEDSYASKQGNAYLATVSKTGLWHFAIPYPLVSLKANILNQLHAPVPNTLVTIVKKLDFVPIYSYTDAAGHFTGKVASNVQLIITVTDPCGNIMDQQEIGPFTGTSSIDALTFTLPEDNTLVIDGTAKDCDDNIVASGAVNISVDGLHYATAIDQGHFKTTIIRCNSSATNIELEAMDKATGIYSTTSVNANNGTITPALVICNQ